jgi:hypothetical protein
VGDGGGVCEVGEAESVVVRSGLRDVRRVIERTGMMYMQLAESVSCSISSTTVQRLNELGPHW